MPGIDLTSNSGQQAAAALTADDAVQRIEGPPVVAAVATDSTDISGDATLSVPGPGLYLVKETTTPAGYVGAAPFLVMLPLTHPTDLDRWLTTVHVYPKNSKASVALEVEDQSAVKLGDKIKWMSRSSIPNRPTLDGYELEHLINPNLELVNPPPGTSSGVVVRLDCACDTLSEGIDYTVGYDPATRALKINMLAPGLSKLEAAVLHHPSAHVVVAYETTVQAEGVHQNSVSLYPSLTAINDRIGVHDTALTKWGPIAVRVHERGNPSNLIEGAKVKLYLSEEDARNGTNPVEVSGMSEWTTDADGLLHIAGLRFSNFVNGLDREPTDPLFRYYYVMPVYYPPGWTGEFLPLPTTVTSEIEAKVVQFVVWRSEERLPNTGAQIAGGTIVAAVALIALGLVFMRRRKQQDETASL